MPNLRLSVLDQSPIPDGSSAAQAFANTLELARLADQLGYARYWLAEHHNTQGLAGSSPEVLIALVAAETKHIRVGSGGVMLSHYSPLKVAESFRVLHALYPGRIDLGVGRAPGSDQLTAVVLAQGRPQPIERFGQQLSDLAGFLYDALPPEHPYHNVHATPRSPGAPEMWLLGSGGDSAAYAAVLGFAFSYAHFINPNAATESLSTYRQHFRALFELDAPRASVAVRVVCADTAAEARRIASSFALQRLRMEQGHLGRVPRVEEAQAYPYSAAELARVEAILGQGFVGDPPQVKARLEHLAAALEIDELVVVTITHDPWARRHSYELLAEAFGLQPAQDQAQVACGTGG
ncbi:MAG TPA: LLM class flavin-dependent oxidoreductase [Ktedonobacterales bacterium]|nr:LLM class flavin-dependent oxidoreductase [Ktedonobacterales bacterium]